MTFACQHPTESPIPESSAFRGQLAQSLSKRPVIWPLALVAEGRTIHAYQSAGVSLTQPGALHHPAPRHSLRRRLQTFFPSRSLSAALSSIDSASSLFKRRFSSSSALRRRASQTSRPPYFDFHLYSVALEIPWRRHTSSVFAPASCSRNTPMICSSLKRLPFIARLLFSRRTLPQIG